MLRWLLAAIYLAAGVLHVAAPRAFLTIVPGWVPFPDEVVFLTGLCEIAGALALGVSSRKIADMAAERPAFVTAISNIPPHGLVPAAGGVIVKGADGFPIGAVGITGDTSDNDEICTLAGIAAAGLTAA